MTKIRYRIIIRAFSSKRGPHLLAGTSASIHTLSMADEARPRHWK